MLRADVVQAHIVPRTINDVLGEATAAGCSKGYASTYAWVLHRQTLLLWKVEDALQASVRRLHLTEPPAGRTFVEIVPHANTTAVTVVVCTGSGQLYVWLDANFPAPPFSQRLFVSANSSSTSEEAVICALSASPADTGASLGFLAVLATSDAALHLYHGSQNGIFPRQFYKPAAAAGPKPGMLGALGSVVKALYSEAFDPLHNVQRPSASAMAALQLQLLQLDGARWKLLVLTPESLDCWLLGTLSGQHSSEQLLWSYNLHGVLSSGLQAHEVTLLAFTAINASHSTQQVTPAPPAAAAAAGQRRSSTAGAGASTGQVHVYVWSAHLGATSLSHQHALSALALEEGNVVPKYLHTTHLAGNSPLLPEPQAGDRYSQWQMLPHNQFSSCLLLSPNGTVLEWLPAAGQPQTLGSSSENLAISCCRPSNGSGAADNWQLLNASYGVLEFLAQDPAAAGTQVEQPAAGAMTSEQAAAASELLSKTVELMAKEYLAGCPYRDLAEGLGERLARLGVFSGPEGRELLVASSSSLVDKMSRAGSGGVSSGSLRALLGDKQVRHDLLLAAYQAGGVLQQLQPQQARAVFEHAEMLAAVVAVLEWQRQQEAAATAGNAVTGVTTTQTIAAAAAIEAAGVIAAEDAAGSAARGAGQQWEVFFSRPAVSAPALFKAVAAQAVAIQHNFGDDDRSGSSQHALQQLLGLSGLLQAAVSGAQAKAGELTDHMPDEVAGLVTAGPTWLAGDSAREAWGQVAEACLSLHSRLSEPLQRLQLALRAHLPALQALLGGLRETIRRSAAPSASLREEYARLPAEHGQCLLDDAAEELNMMRASGLLSAASEAVAVGGAVDEAAADSVAAVQRALVWPIEVLAQQHHCHELLFNTCELLLTTGLLDSERLQMHMKQEVAEAGGALPQDSFTFFVMERWRSSGQLSSLLQLGRQGFTRQLQQFLAGYPSLLWMSEVQSGMVGKAAATLAAAAEAGQGSVAKCRRLLCLSKLAAHAAGGSDTKDKQVQVTGSARLHQLALQEQLQLGGEAPLSTAQLVLAALTAAADAGGTDGAGADAAVVAVEALALMPDQQGSEQYRQLWERSWLAVLQHTPLKELSAARAASRAAGGRPEEFEAALKNSPLFVAILRAAAALADASQAQAGVLPAEVLDATGVALVSRVQQQEPSAVDCLQDLLQEAAEAAFPLLAG